MNVRTRTETRLAEQSLLEVVWAGKLCRVLKLLISSYMAELATPNRWAQNSMLIFQVERNITILLSKLGEGTQAGLGRQSHHLTFPQYIIPSHAHWFVWFLPTPLPVPVPLIVSKYLALQPRLLINLCKQITIQQNVQCAKLGLFLLSFTFVLDFPTYIVAMFSKLGAMDCFVVANLGLIEVNNIPDRSEIL